MNTKLRPSFIPAHEPDTYEFEHVGLKCELDRNNFFAWCGYVILPENHPYFGLDTDDDKIDALDVHGGITFAQEIEGRGFLLGFDCAHAGDKVQYTHLNNGYGVYRTFEYAKAETERLAEQLRKVSDEK